MSCIFPLVSVYGLHCIIRKRLRPGRKRHTSNEQLVSSLSCCFSHITRPFHLAIQRKNSSIHYYFSAFFAYSISFSAISYIVCYRDRRFRRLESTRIVSFSLYQMNGQSEFRALLFRIQDLLSEGDRSRLRSLLGEDVPRNLHEDPSFSGAVRVLESLFDRAIITDQDCTYLINAFTQIDCYDAAKRLQGLFAFTLST